jgi:hypothetical protein
VAVARRAPRGPSEAERRCLDSMFGPFGSATSCSTVLSDHIELRRRRGGVLPTTLGYYHRPLPDVRVERFVERDAE